MSAQSTEFAVTNRVKQCCVLVPTLFSLFLLTMLEVAFERVGEGIYILWNHHDADLFNVGNIIAETRITQKVVREMLFADDGAFESHNAEDVQRLVDRFARSAF